MQSRAAFHLPTCVGPPRVDDPLLQGALQQAQRKLHKQVLVQRRRAVAIITLARKALACSS